MFYVFSVVATKLFYYFQTSIIVLMSAAIRKHTHRFICPYFIDYIPINNNLEITGGLIS